MLITGTGIAYRKFSGVCSWRANDGERYRAGERMSTGVVESTVYQVIRKRFCKQPQMAWTPRGAHLLLQIPKRVLNDDWEATCRE